MINPAYPYSAYHQFVREDDMEGMLRDAFNMQSHGLQSFPPNSIASDDCNLGGNAFTKMGRSVPDEEPNGKGDRKNQQSCHVCGKSRWMNRNTEDVNEDEYEAQSRNNPIKILRYFPLIPRLQRLFMSLKTTESMTWHHDQRTDDGFLRHPVDS
ncbi:hypothetical protein J1N35_005250 [Gossypium stocksii]|uniref:Uncharacterized protein n=1 Tax=Gossypium stocksii TaxID=47602 RepID=A0A9D4AJ34_9ROSI|nr:hypothetical protein J1N35_005250 [Gossypium stocksii]